MRERNHRHGISGQVFAEYAAVLALFAAVAAIFLLLLAAFTEYGWRIIMLVAWEPFT